MNIDNYFEEINQKVQEQFLIAGKAREKGLDNVNKVEIPIATSLAEKAIGLISTIYPQINDKRIVERIIELEKEFGQLDSCVPFRIAEEIAKEKFCKFESLLQAIDAGIRVGFSYITLGVVSSPIEGFTGLKVKKTKNGEDYFVAYFSGPIRSAGTTAGCVVLMLIDYLREVFGYAKYDPDENEVKRYVTENYDYHERITNLQYLPSEEEITFLAKNIPIEISGEPSEDREVSNYKDLPRIETNFIRGGMCLIFSEGLAQKAQKGFRLWKGVQKKGFNVTGWEFLDEYIKIKNKKDKSKSDSTPTYIKDIVAGRPVFSHPSRSGGFRFRYGRSRNNGFSAVSVHPATMGITDSFLSGGTQLKIEKPTKGCTISSCDVIDGPIVKMKDGSVKKIRDLEEAKKVYPDVKEIIYLGDILFTFGDVLNRNYELLKAGYVEEWWALELEKKIGGKLDFDMNDVGFEKAIQISREMEIPLYPKFIFFWREIDYESFLFLIDWISNSKIVEDKLIMPYTLKDREFYHVAKRALEILGCEHKIFLESVIVSGEEARALLINLGLEMTSDFGEKSLEVLKKVKESEEKEVLKIVNSLSKFIIKDKSGTFIGARMGRPEKAKLRKLVGSPHCLFPVGEEGGRLRSFNSALEVGYVRAEFSNFWCNKCSCESVYSKCEGCGEFCSKRYYCPRCDEDKIDKCDIEGHNSLEYKERKVDIRSIFENARRKTKVSADEVPIIKGVKGTSNKDHSCENLGKGLLRAKHNLHVNKDGTIRYDMTEMVLTHFKPREIGTSIEKLREMGYEKDIRGDELVKDEQILVLFPHDILLPVCPDTLDERADDVFLRICKFVDDELEILYGLPRFFNAQKKEDLIGALMVCIAPHICTATVARLIGFSKVQALVASPFMHAAMRRDCLSYGSYVPIKKDGSWQIIKIGDFVEGIKPDLKADIYGTLKKDTLGLEVWSNPGGKKIKQVSKHQPTKMLRFSLEDGRKIELTEDHKLYLKGKKEKRANQIEEGEKLMVSYKKNIVEKDISEIILPYLFEDRADIMIGNIRNYLDKFISLSKHNNFVFRDSFPIKFVKEILIKNNKKFEDLPSEARISIKRDSVSLPLKIDLSREFLEVIGLYISEGYLRKNNSKKGFYQISIAGNEEIRSFVRKVFFSHFGISPSFENKDQVVFSSRIIHELFENYLKIGRKAHEKRIPSIFLDLKKEKMASILRGYFEGDGSVSLGSIRVSCDSVSEGLKHDLSFVLSRFGIYTKFYDYEKEPGSVVRDFYISRNRKVPKFKITKIIIPSDFVKNFKEIGFLSKRKKEILKKILDKKPKGMKIDFDEDYIYPKIVKIEEIDEQISYCFNVSDEHNFFANDILVHNCDGDEAATMLLMDLLLNFSRSFLPAHRGGTQDAPLVLNTYIKAGDVDDQILDFETGPYPLELYELSEQGKHSSEVKIENVRQRLKDGKGAFSDLFITHNNSDINLGVTNTSYKILPSMAEKVDKQMELCSKIRAVDVTDVARLIIERHFIRDTRGNLRKFSMQRFRCSSCNEKYRRPPLTGGCTKCGKKIIFTISEGSILKYMQKSLDLAREYDVGKYILENLELTEMYIQSIFGKEKEKQEALKKWFN